jgi:hypothetical protein
VGGYHRPWSKDHEDILYRMLDDGCGFKEIGKYVGRCGDAVRKKCLKLGLIPPPNGDRTVELSDKAWRDECVAGNDRFIQAMEQAGYVLTGPTRPSLNKVGSTR